MEEEVRENITLEIVRKSDIQFDTNISFSDRNIQVSVSQNQCTRVSFALGSDNSPRQGRRGLESTLGRTLRIADHFHEHLYSSYDLNVH